jgi:Zn-dependent membrane protease YugP
MHTNTAHLILKRQGLHNFSIRELVGLLDDRFMPLNSEIRQAILTLRHPATGAGYALPRQNRATHG